MFLSFLLLSLKHNIYLKFLERAELSDLYDVRFSAEYNTEIEDLRREWDIVGRGQIDSEHKRIVLVNYDGIPSGWNVLEKGVGSKCVDISEFSNFKIVYEYHIKDGVNCNPSLIEENVIEYTDDDEIIKKLLAFFEYYNQI